MLQTIEIYFLLFITYSVIGWCMEVIGKLIELKKFVNRGFLVGPCCAIYGCGGILITLLLGNFKFNPIVLFFMSILVCGILEYLTSYFMEKLFNARWWDYSKKKFNINGRVCLDTIIIFGLLGCFVTYVANPFFLGYYNLIPESILNIISVIILIIFLIDWCVSFGVVVNLRKATTWVSNSIKSDNTEEISKKVKDIILGKGIYKRIFNAYPKLSEFKDKIKERTEEIQKSMNDVKEGIKENIAEKTDSINKIKRARNIKKLKNNKKA